MIFSREQRPRHGANIHQLCARSRCATTDAKMTARMFRLAHDSSATFRSNMRSMLRQKQFSLSRVKNFGTGVVQTLLETGVADSACALVEKALMTRSQWRRPGSAASPGGVKSSLAD